MNVDARTVRQSWLAVVCVLAAGARDGFAVAEEPLRSIAEILALPPAELQASRPASVRGVVTLVRRYIVVQDGDDAIYAKFDPDHFGPGNELVLPQLGDVLEIEGTAKPGAYAPNLYVRRFVVVSSGTLPEPRPADIGRLFGGFDDGRRLVVSGVVQEALASDDDYAWPAVVGCMSRRLIAMLPKRLFPERPSGLVDATVRVTGVVGAFRNDRGEFLGPVVTLVRPEDLEIEAPAPASPFTGAPIPLEAIARFRREPGRDHRLLTGGVVSFVTQRSLWLESGEAGVRVDLAADTTAEALQPGDRVEVAGFVDMDRRIGRLTGAIVRKVGVESRPRPVEIMPAELVDMIGVEKVNQVGSRGSCDGRLVRCSGLVVGLIAAHGHTIVSLSDRGTVVDAVLAAERNPRAALFPLGTEVAVTGILQIDLGPPATGAGSALNPPVERLRILLRGPEDVVVIRAPPWWTPGRLAALLGVIVAVLGGTLSWVVLLRRQVRAQAKQLAVEMQSRRDSALEFEATLRERNRLAANLHDTLLQTLGGIGYQLDACEGSRDRDESESKTHFDVARRMVNHASTELHQSVWAMRSLPIRDQSFPEALDTLVRRVGEGHAARIEVKAEGRFDDVPEFVAGNVLLIVQEAVANALRHGRPGRIDVTVADQPSRQAIEILVRDDGRGFDPQVRGGFTEGHFGIEGMRERATRLGGTLAITSRPGGGTTVHASVRRHEFDADLVVARSGP